MRTENPVLQPIATNRVARHRYRLGKTWEAGVVLQGTEVKALRAGRVSLRDGYGLVSDDDVWLYGVHIGEYEHGTWTNHAALRRRKLLLHRKQITTLALALESPSTTLVPTRLYFLDGRVKVEIALGEGKTAYDKRHDLARRDADRDIERALSDHLRRRRRP